MAQPLLDRMIEMNNKGKTLQEISDKVGFSWQKVWRLIHRDKRYVPGKKGFARLSQKEHFSVSAKGGKHKVIN